MTRYPLARDGVFWTLQGEGTMRGLPMAFVRLAGCSVACPQCDTDYRVAERVTVDEILRRVLAVTPSNGHSIQWVWITGGEPTDHDLAPLIDGLRGIQRAVALATSGVRSTAGLDISHLSVSPHDWATLVQRGGHELKVVPGLNGLRLEDMPTDLRFLDKFIQPLWGADMTPLRDWVLAHPGWRLGDQAHKVWGLR